MKNDHIPLLSYVFIGITSLVLTYATISDTTGEIINPSPNAPTSPNESSSKSLNSMSGFIDKLKTMVIGEETTQPDMNVPVATPVQSTIEKPTFGGKTKNKNKKRKPNFTKRNKSNK